MNIIDKSGILAISTRLQRLSEQLRKDGAMIYQSFDIDFEPKWFPVIFTLHHKNIMSVVEIANEIGYTHPSTISLLKELEKQKFIQSRKDKQDERKRLIVLAPKGVQLIEKMQPVWELMSKVLGEIADNKNNLLQAIIEAEEKIAEQSFYQRALKIKKET
ncbi:MULTISPECIES: MarR family winged helix-turn-helix transcriptional regulator [Chryseobacterium]|uniref:MarR family transcriptional repressor of mepA n=1 Tax=Chryseobacterium camelliae TaxID=1265445 RepID=A0ABU0TGH2_9FLAO|nr:MULTISPECIES: MarR family transcriptional regulator [Chryseobacterium]MDT3406035.1 MarR family transcriptional repressor of mepA [Pseudacidovorax intermedius]MDQ1096164.1 MarR family transcriptional repressor of mepA [Chryseobacterium camelliae]MDQ1100100.1 MarR family transcriptional repressor of mepA [Chryseobacterium sp. SORGH_AS_1048]MDR6087444.1 MarR family transcriptional repressor of mepA [Chryseobacterium sp. SORGH_AS_0909]MDR6131818.1 MarR family transcriptional repressor of mepA [